VITQVPFWQSGQAVGMVAVGVGTGVVVGGSADVVSGIDSVEESEVESDSDGVREPVRDVVRDSVVLAECVPDIDGVIVKERDGVKLGVLLSDGDSETDGVNEGVSVVENVIVRDGGGVTVTDFEREAEKVAVRVGGGVTVVDMDGVGEGDREGVGEAVRVLVGGGDTVSEEECDRVSGGVLVSVKTCTVRVLIFFFRVRVLDRVCGRAATVGTTMARAKTITTSNATASGSRPTDGRNIAKSRGCKGVCCGGAAGHSLHIAQSPSRGATNCDCCLPSCTSRG
jgi:hypothetical protein